jgi:6-phosphogluconolactonase
MENIVISNNSEVKIFKNDLELHENTAGYLSASIRHHINRNGRCTFVLSGGNTPKKLYDTLSKNYKDTIDWSKVYIFWGDERCVPPTSVESNFKMTYEHLITKIPLPEKNYFRIEGELPPVEAAEKYEKILIDFFGNKLTPSFDIMLLGIGKDGHTASLFPGTKVLNVRDKLVSEVFVKRLNSWRVTLTLPVINSSKNIIFIAEGTDKSEIVSDVINSKNENLPATKIKPSDGKLLWLLDKNAASIGFPEAVNNI